VEARECHEASLHHTNVVDIVMDMDYLARRAFSVSEQPYGMSMAQLGTMGRYIISLRKGSLLTIRDV
jgi:hypothetical protein